MHLKDSLRSLRTSLAQSQRVKGIALLAAISVSVLASSQPKAASVSAAATPGAKATHHWFQIGSASWYGRSFQGKRTATGERFDMNALTCAHRTLPLGSWLRVTNLRNRRSTFVRVNDRGPYSPNAIVDLSYAAAKRVGLLGKTPVRVERVSPNDPELARELVAQLSQTESPFVQQR